MEKEVNYKTFLIAIIGILVIVLVTNNFMGFTGSAITGKNIQQQVKCVFAGSTTTQKCYLAGRNEIGCSGIETCVVSVKGSKGERLTWKSSCGVYAYTTIIDVYNRNLYATFKCAETSKTTKGETSRVIKCYPSTNCFLNSGVTAMFRGIPIRLLRVGSAGAIVVDVNGVQETIFSLQNKTISGITIRNKETFYDYNNQASSAATLIIY